MRLNNLFLVFIFVFLNKIAFCDFRGSEWGDSIESVIENELKNKDSKLKKMDKSFGALLYKVVINNLNSSLYFEFKNSSLDAATFVVDKADNKEKTIDEVLSSFINYLDKKYGDPKIDFTAFNARNVFYKDMYDGVHLSRFNGSSTFQVHFSQLSNHQEILDLIENLEKN